MHGHVAWALPWEPSTLAIIGSVHVDGSRVCFRLAGLCADLYDTPVSTRELHACIWTLMSGVDRGAVLLTL